MSRVKLFSTFLLLMLLLSSSSAAVVAQEAGDPSSTVILSSIQGSQPVDVESVVDQAYHSYLRMQADQSASDTDKIKNAVAEYFRLHYESWRLGQLVPFDSMTVGNDESKEFVSQEVKKRSVEMSLAETWGLRYTKYQLRLDFEDIALDAEQARVRVREGHEVVFASSPDVVSKMGGLVHTVSLLKHEGQWRIVQDDYEDDLARFMRGTNLTLEQVFDNIRGSKERADRMLKEPNATPDVAGADMVLQVDCQTAWHYYDNGAAVSYAHTWVDNSVKLRNSSTKSNPSLACNDLPYADFDLSCNGGGGDCTNYASQVIRAGGAPLDSGGSLQWYYNNINSRSPSWTDVQGLGDYLLNNYWYGPVGTQVYSLGSLYGGDIIQLNNGTSWYHTLVVLSVWQPTPDSVFIACHSADKEDYPLSYFSYAYSRWIHISGYCT